jgi:hypothetical protein
MQISNTSSYDPVIELAVILLRVRGLFTLRRPCLDIPCVRSVFAAGMKRLPAYRLLPPVVFASISVPLVV